jgi:HrpA-like RNA helicase
MTLAERCSNEKETKLGGLIGYNVRFDDCTSKDT